MKEKEIREKLMEAVEDHFQEGERELKPTREEIVDKLIEKFGVGECEEMVRDYFILKERARGSDEWWM